MAPYAQSGRATYYPGWSGLPSLRAFAQDTPALAPPDIEAEGDGAFASQTQEPSLNFSAPPAELRSLREAAKQRSGLRSLRPKPAPQSELRSLRQTSRQATRQQPAPQPRPAPAAQPAQPSPDEAQRRRTLTGLIVAFEDLKRQGKREQSTLVARSIARRGGDLLEVAEGEGGWWYVKPKPGSGFTLSQPQSMARTPHRDAYGRPISAEQAARIKMATDPLLDEGAFARAEAERTAKKHAEWMAKPWLERTARRAHEAFAQGGLHASKMARQTAELAGDFPAWERREREASEELARRRAARPSTLATEIGEGIIEAIPSASGALGLTVLSGGSAPAAIGVGAGMGAAGTDWSDPKKATLQTVLGGAAPYVGGRLGQKIAAPIASRLTRPAAQRMARVGGEVGGGGLGNVGAALAMGETSPRELIKQTVIGSALSAPGAVMAGRRPVGAVRQIPRDTATREHSPSLSVRDTQPLAPITQYPNAPITQRLLALSRAPREDAPTAGLPMRPVIEGPPTIDAAIDAAINAPRPTTRPRPVEPGATITGPRQAEAPLEVAPNPSPQRTPILETLSALRKAGLLTGIKTHLRNVGGNLTFQPLEEVSRIPGSIADIAISAVTKRRTFTGPSAPATVRAAVEAATQGLKDAKRIMRFGPSEADLRRLDLSDRGEIRSGSKVVDAYTNFVFRTLGAEDAIFRSFAYRRALADRAKAQALTEARDGRVKHADVNRRARQIEAAPDEAMAADALLDSEVATFNNENLLSRSYGAARREMAKTRGGRVADFAVDLVLPFKRTPANLIARTLEYTPGGYAMNAYQVADAIAKRAFTPAQQRAFAQTFGRATTGSALILLGYKLGEAGLMTGFVERDEAKRERDKAIGRTPGSILNPFTNTWHQISAFTPVGSLMVLGATLAREQNRPLEDESQRGANLAGAGLQAVTQHPLLQGSREISSAVTQPGSLGDRAGRMVGSFVPTIVSDIGELTDTTRREGRGFTGQIQKRLPIARRGLPAARDALGRPLEDRWTAFVDPTLTSSARERVEPFAREMVRLDVGLPRIEAKRGESEDVLADREWAFGQAFTAWGEAMVSSPSYAFLDDQMKREAFKSLRRRLISYDLMELLEEGEPNLTAIEAIMDGALRRAIRRREREEGR